MVRTNSGRKYQISCAYGYIYTASKAWPTEHFVACTLGPLCLTAQHGIAWQWQMPVGVGRSTKLVRCWKGRCAVAQQQGWKVASPCVAVAAGRVEPCLWLGLGQGCYRAWLRYGQQSIALLLAVVEP